MDILILLKLPATEPTPVIARRRKLAFTAFGCMFLHSAKADACQLHHKSGYVKARSMTRKPFSVNQSSCRRASYLAIWLTRRRKSSIISKNNEAALWRREKSRKAARSRQIKSITIGWCAHARQPIESLFNWVIEKTQIQRAKPCAL